MSADRLGEAIAAFQAGDRAQAKILFQEVITTDPNNDTAWYYFAALQDDPARRRAALQRVLEINPQHQRAKDVLDSMDAAQASVGSVPPAPSRPATRPQPTSSEETPAPARPASGAGFTLPFAIPGAPERVTLGGLWEEWLQLFLAGINVLMQKPGVYETEIARATWWRFWLLVMGAVIVSTVVSLITSLFGGWFLIGIVSAVLTLALTAGITYAGVWLSDWWAKRHGSTVPQWQHAMTAALPYVPAAIVSSVLGLIPFLGGLLGFVISIYAWYIMGLGFQAVHQFREANQSWITVAFFVIGIIIGGMVLGLIAGLFGAPFALAGALF